VKTLYCKLLGPYGEPTYAALRELDRRFGEISPRLIRSKSAHIAMPSTSSSRYNGHSQLEPHRGELASTNHMEIMQSGYVYVIHNIPSLQSVCRDQTYGLGGKAIQLVVD
jgi:hypothetical protein